MKNSRNRKLKIVITSLLSFLLIATTALVKISKSDFTPNSISGAKSNLVSKHNHNSVPELKNIEKCNSYESATKELYKEIGDIMYSRFYFISY